MNHIRQSLIGRCLNFFAMLAFLALQVPGAAFADTTAGESEARKAIATAPPAKVEAANATKKSAATETTAGQSEPGIAASLGKSFRSFMDKLTGQSAQNSESGASGQSGQTTQVDTKVTHEALKFFVPERRIRLGAAVVDTKGVTMVRAYFKGKTQADYVFVPMEAQQTAKDSYVANLPAMAKSNTEIQYLFLVVNGANEVLKTEPFVVKVKDSTEAPSWQMVSDDGSIKLFTEVPDALAVAASFSDSVSLNVVESGARFGLVAQLYSASGSATASGVAASASNVGTTSVATTGMSTVTIAAAAAGLIGVAAAGGGGSSVAPSVTVPIPVPVPNNPNLCNVASKSITICVVNTDGIQDDYYDVYVNSVNIGPANNVPGGQTCFSNVTLQSGSNTVLLKLTQAKGVGTVDKLTANPGNCSSPFTGTQDHSWTFVAP